MSTTVYIYETGFGGGASGGPQDPITIRVVLMVCPSQVQHMLGKGEQDLCHLQGGEETVALHSAGHHVVRGSVSMPWPRGVAGERGLDWLLQGNSTCLGLSQYRDLLGQKGLK